MRCLLFGLLLVGIGVVSTQKYIEQGDTEGPDCDCGRRGNKVRVIGGIESGRNALPFMAALTLSEKIPFCGATIITRKHAVTSAQCTINTKKKIKELRLLTGAHDIMNAENEQYVPVFKTIEHPQFDAQGRNDHDIAIVVLETNLSFRNIVKPACIINKWTDMDNKYLLLIGWGFTRKDGPISTVLQEAIIGVIPWEICNKFYPDELHKFKSQFCTYEKGSDSCQGDAGGPLLTYDYDVNRYIVVGLISFGRECASDSPSVNTHIGYYLDWIKDVVNATSSGAMKTCSSRMFVF